MEIKAIELFCKDNGQQADSTIIRLQRRVIASIISEINGAGYVLPQLKDGTPIVLCIPAAAINAPHQRDRVWFVAHTDSYGNKQFGNDNKTGRTRQGAGRSEKRERQWRPGFLDGLPDLLYPKGTISNISSNGGKYASIDIAPPVPGAPNGRTNWQNEVPGWETWPTEPPFCGGNDGLPLELDGITFSAWRAESVKAYGNAIVPQVALEIFRAIEKADSSI